MAYEPRFNETEIQQFLDSGDYTSEMIEHLRAMQVYLPGTGTPEEEERYRQWAITADIEARAENAYREKLRAQKAP